MSNTKFHDLSNNPIKEESSLPGKCIILAWVLFIVGFVGGFFIGKPDSVTAGFNWFLAIATWISSCASGLFFLGLGEIIYLLEKISNK